MASSQESLRSFALLRDIDEPTLDALAGQAERRAIETGERLFEQGRAADRLHLVLRGRLRLEHLTEEGRRLVTGFVRPGMLLGFAALGEGALPNALSAVALEPSRLLGWPARRLATLLDRSPRLDRALRGALLERLDALLQQGIDLATASVPQRLARLLLRESSRGEPTVRCARRDLADMAGATHFTVSRVLQSWQRAGLVDLGRERVKLIDREGLTTLGKGPFAS